MIGWYVIAWYAPCGRCLPLWRMTISRLMICLRQRQK